MKPDRITDWTRQVGTVRSAIDTLTAVSHNQPVDDAELHENSLNAYAALDWLAGEHERLIEQLEAMRERLEQTGRWATDVLDSLNVDEDDPDFAVEVARLKAIQVNASFPAISPEDDAP